MILRGRPEHGRIRYALRRLSTFGTAARGRLTAGVWPVLQQTAALTVSWVIATHLVSHHQPFFAPIATVVALNASLGERGTNAVRLLVGVFLGILTGETALLLLGDGAQSLAAATFTALTLALVLSSERLVLAQAAASAILVIVMGTEESGFNRLTDALIGAGVALVVSQVLFPAEPIALLRRAERVALRDIADALALASDALARDDDRLGRKAAEQLLTAHTTLADVSRIRETSRHASRRTAVWWWRADAIAREAAHAEQLALLNNSCLTVIRATLRTGTDTEHRAAYSRAVWDIGDALAGLAESPGDYGARRRTAERVRTGVRELAGVEAVTDAGLRARIVADDALRQAADEVMRYVGARPRRDGGDGSGSGDGSGGREELDIAPPPDVPRWLRRRRPPSPG